MEPMISFHAGFALPLDAFPEGDAVPKLFSLSAIFLLVFSRLTVFALLMAAAFPVLTYAEPMLPRAWTTLDLSDVDPAPYRWKGPLEVRAKGFVSNSSSGTWLHAFNHILPEQGDRSSTLVSVLWHERKPDRSDLVVGCGDGNLDERGSVFAFPNVDGTMLALVMQSKTHYVTVNWWLNRDYPHFKFNEDVLARISRDLLRKIEPFAELCSEEALRTPKPPPRPRGSPPPQIRPNWLSGIVPNGTIPPDNARAGQAGESFGQPDYHASDPIPTAVEPQPATGAATVGHIGADEIDPNRLIGSQALRQTGLPPGAEVQFLRFFSSGWDAPGLSDRQYRMRYKGGDVQYINWELGMNAAEGTQPFEYVVETVILRNGTEYARYVSNPFPFDPGACKPWCASNHGMGNLDRSWWQPGSYEIQLWVNEENIVSGIVRVD